MTGHCNKVTNWVCSSLKTVLRKSGDRYHSYCATHKTQAMTTYQGGAGHKSKDRDLFSHIEDTRSMDIGPDNDNENTNSSDAMIAFRGSEAGGHLGDLLPNSQANIGILAREINSLQQCIKAGEGQPEEGLNHID